MSHVLFRAGGPLTNEHSGIYVKRRADRDAMIHLRRMDYLLLIEPRQQGKTSLINHLMCHPALEDIAFAYLDVTTPDRSSETTWYKSLCSRILRQLRGFIPRDQWPVIPQNCAGWRDFLWDVAALATADHQIVVIALDEIGAVTFPGATAFFSVLRDVYNSRQAETELRQITFLLAGAFRPHHLIRDDRISPFNIAQRVRLRDFDRQYVNQLTQHLLLNYKGDFKDFLSEEEFAERTQAISEEIVSWVGGQPYLTQWICDYLTRYGPAIGPQHVGEAVERLRRDDSNHLPPILERLNKNEGLCDYLRRIVDGERMKFYPGQHQRQADLELLGVIKEGPEGYCVVRNRLYRQVLMETLEQQVEPVPRRSSLVPDVERIHSLRVKAAFDEVWRCLVYTRDQEDSPWATQSRLWWSVDEKDHSKSTKSATVLLGINRPSAASIYDFNERRLHLFQGVQGWTVIEVQADLAAESQSDPEATKLFDDFLASFVQMFERLGYQVSRMNNQTDSTQGKAYSRPKNGPHPELIDALERRSLALFIGADLPSDVTGVPSRADLARELARRKALDESLSLAEVAQRMARGDNRWGFTSFIRDQLDNTGKSPQSFHQRIVEIVQGHHIETVITTAYDNLLELAFQDAGMPFNRVVRGSDVSFINPNYPTLIKLYGDAEQPDTLVVTEDDHYSLWRDRDKEDLLHEVRTVLRRQTVLFLGYNLADPDFNLLWREVLDRAGRFNRTAYAVWPGLPEGEARMWHDRGIVILDADPLGVLGAFEAPSAPERRPEPQVDVPTSEPSTKGKDMDYESGLDALAGAAQGTHWHSDFRTQEARLSENLEAKRRYGDTETRRADRAAIIEQLNRLALDHCDVSFNDLCQGIHLKTSKEPQPVDADEPPVSLPLRRERALAGFKLQASRLVDLEFEVRTLKTPMGEQCLTSRLPYDQNDLIAILKALPVSSIEAASLKSSQVDALRELGLLTKGSLVSDLHARVGRSLYQSLFPGNVGAAFQMAWNQVRAQRGLVSLQLRFDEDAVALARYPWELLYYRRHLLPGGAVELTRYISYPESPTALSIEPPLQVLYVESRPTDLKSLPVGREQEAVRAALEALEEKGLLVLETLSRPTYDALIDRVERNEDHVLHFDGHGTVARRCPDCEAMNYPHQTSCQRPGCDRTLMDVLPLGYLAFEKEGTRKADWIDSKTLENLLYPSTVRVAVLSACRSGEVRGETLFAGVGPALIQAGVPAVVAMQVPVTVHGATRFMQGFYGALARFESLPEAVTSGRRRLFRGREWFIPALYLRSQDDEGQLLRPA